MTKRFWIHSLARFYEQVFLSSVSWWSSTVVWVTASLLDSPGLFSVFWPISLVWIVSIRALNSKSFSSFTNLLLTVPRAPITIAIIVTLIFNRFFFNSLVRSRYLSFFSLSFNFTQWSAGRAKSTIRQVLFFLQVISWSGRLAEIKWSVCISFSMIYSGLSIYHLFVWSNFNFLHNSQWITLPTQSCLILHSFCASLLH